MTSPISNNAKVLAYGADITHLNTSAVRVCTVIELSDLKARRSTVFLKNHGRMRLWETF